MTAVDPRLAELLGLPADTPTAPAPTIEPKRRRDPAHPLAGRGGRVSARRAALYDRIGNPPDGHSCVGCGQRVWWIIRVDRVAPPFELQVLVLDLDRPDTDPDNLAPACGRCVGHATQLREAP